MFQAPYSLNFLIANGETLVVSGAAGAVGSIEGQMGKNIGKMVIKYKLLQPYASSDSAISTMNEGVLRNFS